MGKHQETDQTLVGDGIRIINLSGQEIPFLSFGEIQDVDSDGNLEIVRPTADSIPASRLVLTGPTIIPNGKPAIAFPAEAGKLWIVHNPSEDDPEPLDSFGTVKDEWFGEGGKSGFIVHGVRGGRANVSPFRAGLLRAGVTFWTGTNQGIPPGSEGTSGPSNRFSWTNSITTTGFRVFQAGVCDFDGVANHPTKGFPAPDSFCVIAGVSGQQVSNMVGGVVATTMLAEMDLDIITEPFDFSVTDPTFITVQSLVGVILKSFAFRMSFETRNSLLFNPSYGVFVPPGHGIETIHGVRLNVGSESMNTSHNAAFSVSNFNSILIVGV